VPVLGPGQSANTLSCSGGFSYPKRAGEKYSYDYVGINGPVSHDECCCAAVPWAGWIRHIDPQFNQHADQQMVAHNNDYSKKWCEEMIKEHGGLGGNKGAFTCSRPCTRN